MEIPKSLTTVTNLSKTIALILFITLPFIGFLLGMTYQKGVTRKDSNQINVIKVSPTKAVTTDKFCGGIGGIQCQEGYSCKLDGSYPDASGVCKEE